MAKTKKTEQQEPSEKTARKKILQEALEQIDKDFGPGTVMTLNQKPVQNVKVISTGSLGLDLSLGIGGLPKGRVVEIYGPESSGKTTLAMHVIANCQKEGGTAAIIDAEHAFDTTYAKALGINTDNLLICQPDYGEQGFDVLDRLISTNVVDLIVVDSVAAMVPKAELEGDSGEMKMGLHARLMSQVMRKLVAKISKSNAMIIFINQLRDKIGVMFGSPETTTGGNALKFYASIRIDIRRKEQIKDGDQVIANKVRAKVVKNKLAPPFKAADFDLIFGEGIDSLGEIIDASTHFKIIEKSGSWFSYQGDKLGQGRNAVRSLLKDNPDLTEELKQSVLDAIKQSKL